jgi:hypothetical protein
MAVVGRFSSGFVEAVTVTETLWAAPGLVFKTRLALHEEVQDEGGVTVTVTCWI